MFADDTNVFVTGKNINDTVNIMNEKLNKLIEWLYANKLSLNVNKTHFIIFSSKKKKILIENDITISGSQIEQVEATKFVGVYLDAKLSWNYHINYIDDKIAKSIGIISKAKRVLNTETLRILYYTFVYPYLHYGIEVWGCTSQSYLLRVYRLQKKIIRIIASAHHKAHLKNYS